MKSVSYECMHAQKIFVARSHSNEKFLCTCNFYTVNILAIYGDISRLCSGKLNVVFTDVSMLLFCQYDYLLTCKNLEL